MNEIIKFLKENSLSTKLIFIGILIIIVIVLVLIKKFNKNEEKESKSSKTRKIVTIAIFSALSAVLYLFVKFPLPFIFPAFLDIQLSNVPAIIMGLLIGPVEGAIVVIIRTIIKIPFSSTLGVGELADLIIGIVVVLISALIYRVKKTKKQAIVALVTSTVSWVIIAIIANYLILAPFYIALYFKGEIEGFIKMCSIIPGINENNYMRNYLLLAVLPFNMLLSIIVNIITFLVYKRISFLFHKKDDKE